MPEALTPASVSPIADVGSFGWFDIRQLPLEGKGWPETAGPFHRLPAHAQPRIPEEVWVRGETAAGLCVRFRTDADEIWAQWQLARPPQASAVEPMVRSAGLDLYGTDEEGRLHWVGAANPSEGKTDQQAWMAGRLDGQMREYALYLPLGIPLVAARIGVPVAARFQPGTRRSELPVVVYGTSIVHGGAASRPGLAWPAILGRRLGKPVVNLGFPGRGRMEVEMAELIAEVPAACYVVDCLPNMSADLGAERAEVFVRRLRERRPAEPIVLVEEGDRGGAVFMPELRKQISDKRIRLRECLDGCRQDGMDGLYHVPGEGLYGDDCEAMMDTIHPGSIGMMRIAQAVLPAVREALGHSR